jgi:hypothetical protein
MPRNLNPHYLNLARNNITGAEVMEAIEAWADASSMSLANRKKYRSVVSRTLESATSVTGRELERANVTLIVRDLPVYARRVSGRPADNAATAGRYLEGVSGYRRNALERQIPVGSVSAPELALMFDAAGSEAGRNAVARVERAIHAAGYKLSDDMVPERLIAVGDEMGIKSIAKDVTCWRAARERLAEMNPGAVKSFGVIGRAVHRLAAGLEAVGNLPALLKAAGYQDHPDDLSPMEQIAWLAPRQHAQLERYLSAGRTKARKNRPSRVVTPDTKETAVQRICKLVGLWCRFYDASKLRDSDLRSYFTIDCPDRYAAAEALDNDPYAPNGAHVAPMVPLIQYLCDESLPSRVVHSPYAQAFTASKHAPRYTPAMLSDMESLWTIVNSGFRGKIGAPEMADLAARHKAVRDTMHTHKARASSKTIAKDKVRAVKAMSYDLLLVIGLPMLAREVRAAKEGYFAGLTEVLRAGQDPQFDVQLRKLKALWYDAALAYLSVALPLVDGKRRKQYENGALGYSAHFRPEYDGHDLVQMITRWTREDDDCAALKDRTEGGYKPPVRLTALSPALVDLDILNDWIRVHRVDDLVSARLITSREDYDLTADLRAGKFALFVSPSHEVTTPTHGRSDLSSKMGEALHYIVRDILGRKDVPEYGSRVAEGWTHIFSEHTSRLLLSSSIGGTYGLWSVCERLLDDVESTCKGEYNAVAETVDTLHGKRNQWERPKGLESQLFRMLAFDRAGDTQRPTLFDPLAELLALDDADPGSMLPKPVRAILVAERETARNRTPRRKRRKLGLHKRTARPGQKPPVNRAQTAKLAAA